MLTETIESIYDLWSEATLPSEKMLRLRIDIELPGYKSGTDYAPLIRELLDAVRSRLDQEGHTTGGAAGAVFMPGQDGWAKD